MPCASEIDPKLKYVSTAALHVTLTGECYKQVGIKGRIHDLCKDKANQEILIFLNAFLNLGIFLTLGG